MANGRTTPAVVLTAPRVLLRAPLVEDAEAMFTGLASDPTWLIEWRGTGEFVGACGWVRPRPDTVELGYCLGRRWWRQGIMSEVAEVLVEEARRDPTEPQDCLMYGKAVR